MPERNFFPGPRTVQAPAGPGGVHEETRAASKRRVLAFSAQGHASRSQFHLLDLNLIEVLGSRCLSFAHQKMIEVGAIPMRVSNPVSRAGRDEKLMAMFGGVGPFCAERVTIEAESAL